MKFFKHWKILLALVFVFGAGAVTGTVWTHWQFKRAFERGLNLDNWTAGAMDALQKKLNLTPEQKPKIRAIVEESNQRFRTTFGRTIQEAGAIMVQSWRQVERELTPEQQAIHQRMCQEFRDAVKAKLNVDLPRE